MKVQNLEGVTFGSVVTDLDLEAMDDSEWGDLYELWIDRALLVFPSVFLSVERQDRFARRFVDL